VLSSKAVDARGAAIREADCKECPVIDEGSFVIELVLVRNVTAGGPLIVLVGDVVAAAATDG